MANFLYTNAKRLMLTGAFDWVHDPIVVILIAKDLYAPSINHATLLDVPAEARVATHVALGKSIKQTAMDLHVQPTTVRTQLDNVFRKTGTGKQSERVAELLSLPDMRVERAGRVAMH